MMMNDHDHDDEHESLVGGTLTAYLGGWKAYVVTKRKQMKANKKYMYYHMWLNTKWTLAKEDFLWSHL